MYNKKIHVDMDVVLYQAAYHCQKRVEVIDDDGSSTFEIDTIDVEEGYKCVESKLFFLNKYLKPKARFLYLSNPDKSVNHRHQLQGLAKPYKGNRKGKPILYQEIRDFISSEYTPRVAKYGEADDMIGIMMEDDDVSCSIDKDFWQIHGYHWDLDKRTMVHSKPPGTLSLFYKLDKKGKKVPVITGTGFKWFCAQMIMGDGADNIPGIPRVGAVKAYAHLEHCKTEAENWKATRSLYQEKGLSQHYFYNHCQLLWIMRKPHEVMPTFSAGYECGYVY